MSPKPLDSAPVTVARAPTLISVAVTPGASAPPAGGAEEAVEPAARTSRPPSSHQGVTSHAPFPPGGPPPGAADPRARAGVPMTGMQNSLLFGPCHGSWAVHPPRHPRLPPLPPYRGLPSRSPSRERSRPSQARVAGRPAPHIHPMGSDHAPLLHLVPRLAHPIASTRCPRWQTSPDAPAGRPHAIAPRGTSTRPSPGGHPDHATHRAPAHPADRPRAMGPHRDLLAALTGAGHERFVERFGRDLLAVPIGASPTRAGTSAPRTPVELVGRVDRTPVGPVDRWTEPRSDRWTGPRSDR
jgi:hypothetical protein